MFKTIKKITSCFLALCMLLSIAPTGVFATETINYVSLGASNVNGYGLDGYLPAGTTVENKETANVFGYRQCPDGSYVDLVRDALENEGYTVNLSQLAISSMRVEELRVLLDESYNGDAYTAWRFIGPGKWFENAAVTGGLEALRTDYAASIADAELITVDIGVNNFGVYLSNQLASGGNAYDDDLSLVDPELAEEYNNAKAYVYELIAEHAGEYVAAVADLEFVVDAMAYALAGFCINYDIVMEKIYTLNPDAAVVAVSIQNLMEGLEATIPGVDGTVPFGELFGALVDAANLYISVGSPYSNKYLFADVSQNGRVEFFLDQLLAYDGNPASLDRDMRDCFDVYDDDLMLSTKIDALAASYGLNDDQKANAKNIAYDVVAEIMQLGAANNVLDLGVVLAGGYGSVEDGLLDAIEAEVMQAINDVVTDPSFEYSISADFFNDIAAANGVPASLVNTVATLGIRTGIGNSFYGHPNRNGHEEICNAIIGAIENGTTGKEVVSDKIETLIDELNELIEEYGPNAVERIYTYLESEGYIAELETVVKNLIADLENPDSDLSQKLVAETDKLLAILEAETGEELPSGEEVITAIRNYEETLAELEEYIANNEEIQEAIAEVEAIIAQINDIIANPEAYIQNIIDDVVAKYEEELEAATKTDYVACGENHYVAFAGTNTAGVEDYEYSYQVATYIDDEATSHHNFTDGTPIKDLVAYITSLEGESLEALKDATIITYQTDAKDIVLPLFVDDVVVTDADWAALLDVDASKVAEIKATITTALTGGYAEEGTEAIENGIDKALEIKEKIMTKLPEDWATTLVENGAKADEVIDTILTTAIEIVNSNLDEEIVNIAAPYTEELVFNTVAYLINNIKSLEAIKAINPDALIAVVGLNNPVKGLTANINGEAINLGEYVEYFIEATNVYNTIYAAASENVIFVEADGAEIAGYQGAINIDTSNLSTIGNAIVPLSYKIANGAVVTEAGHNYIANQIKAAITLVDHIDEDGNDICDKCGENLAPATPSRPRPSGSGGSSVKEETPASAFKFTDVQSDKWYYDTVKKVVEKGLMNGISETKFAPELEVTRGMFVTILYRAAGEPEVSAATNFADVTTDKYYAKAVAWANANGIVKGITETEFAPDNNITREQMAAILYRYAKNKAAAEVNYTDKHAISDYAMEAVAWAKAAGIMQGNADGTFAPVRNASRAEAAAVFVRMFKF